MNGNLCSFTSIMHDTHITKDQECPSVPPIQEQDITPLDISHHNTQRGFSAHPDSSDKENQPLNPSLIPTSFTPTVPTQPFDIGKQSTPSNPVPPRPPSPMSSEAETLFAHLKSAEYEFNNKCQAMILLAKLPPSMDAIA